jgi:ubiquinone/menaquinone biosynthesis C-methylase UbiE
MVDMTEPRFRTDLYRGTAGYYDRFRPSYPDELIDDLAARAGADGTGSLLDLACGTGLVSFALRARFASIWAVDQEPDMIRVASEKARALGVTANAHTTNTRTPNTGTGLFRFVTCAAEDLSAPEQAFDLVTIGNALHRLRRDEVAVSVLRWLKPGGFLALLWGGSPWDGDAPWQEALRSVMQRWQHRPGADQRVPTEYAAARRERPDLVVLREAGFTFVGRYEFGVRHCWTTDDIAGFIASTSVLSPAALGNDAPEFDAVLRRELIGCQPDGEFRQDAAFAFDLARRPA